MALIASDCCQIRWADTAAGDVPPEAELAEYKFCQGDALVFVSNKFHGVAPVTAGRRNVMVIDLTSCSKCGRSYIMMALITSDCA